MPDNTRLPQGTQDGDTYASDDVSGVKYQRVKISVGADGVAGDATPANPLPVAPPVGSSGAFTSANNTVDAIILAANASRKGAEFYNDADCDFLIAAGFVATTLHFSARIPPRGLYVSNFQGNFHGLFVATPGGSGSQSLQITEET